VGIRVLTPGNDHTTGFVTKDEWGFDHEIADPAMLVVVDVGATGADRLNPDEDLMRAGNGHRPPLQRDVMNPPQNGDVHALRKVHISFLPEDQPLVNT
jgi:hypothetical protein